MLMMGSAYYGNGGSSSSSSNLSAAAPPFTVDRSVPKPFSPLIDFTDQSYHPLPKLNTTPQHNWLPPNSTHDFFSSSSTEFDPIPSSIDYTYSPSIAHVGALSSASPSADDVHYSLLPATLPEPSNPYYQPFVSSNSRNNTTSSKLPCQNGHELLSSTHVVTPPRPSADSFTHTVSPLDHLPQWGWQQSNQVQGDLSFDSKENYMNQGFYAPKTVIYDEGFNGIDVEIPKHGKHADSEQTGSKSLLSRDPEFFRAAYSTMMTSTSSLAAPKPYSTLPYISGGRSGGYESPLSVSIDKCLRKQGPSSTDAHLTMKLPSSVTIRPPHQEKCSTRTMSPLVGKVKDSGRDNPTITKETDQCRTEKKPNFDASQLRLHLGKYEEQTSNTSGLREGPSVEKLGVQLPRAYPDGFSAIVDNNNSLNSADNFAESLDHQSSALDSPCWKGATVSQWSTFEVERSADIRKVDDLSGKDLLGSQVSPCSLNNKEGAVPQNVCERELDDYITGPEDCLASCKGLVGTNMNSDEKFGSAIKFQAQSAAVSCCSGVPLSDGIHGTNKGDSLSEKSVEKYDREPPTKQPTQAGLKIKTDDFDCRSSHVPFHAVEHVLFSPPSAEHSPSELMIPSNRQLAPDVYVQTLVNSMHDLSELLLFRRSNEACELREEDCETLKEVLKNILSSIMNDTNDLAPLEKLLTPEKQHAHRKAFCCNSANSQGPKLALPQVSFPVKVQSLLEDHDTLYGRKDEKVPNLSSEQAATETVKHDRLLQALKRILAENLHDEDETQPETHLYKNLWLEAEAQLCSVNHVARYYRMRSEMEKCHLQPNALSQNPVAKGIFPRPDVSSDISFKGTLGFDTKSQQVLDTPDSDTSISSANSNPDETAARSQALKSPVINSLTTIYSAAKDDMEAATPEIVESIQDTQLSSKSSPTNDLDASVMARLQILRRRADSLISRVTEDHQPEGADLTYPFLRSPQSLCKDVNITPNGEAETILQKNSVKSKEEPLIVKEHCNLHNGNGTLNTWTTRRESGRVPPLKGLNFCSTGHPPDVSARFAMLKSRATKQGSASSMDVENSSSSKISPVQNNVDVMGPGVRDTHEPIFIVNNHLMSGSGRYTNDSEGFYKDQLQTLDHTSSPDSEAWRPGGLRRNRPFHGNESVDKTVGVYAESLQMEHDGQLTEDKSDVEAFHSCARYDPVILHPMANRRSGDQSHVSWYESSSPDWEHVLKEEVAGKPC